MNVRKIRNSTPTTTTTTTTTTTLCTKICAILVLHLFALLVSVDAFTYADIATPDVRQLEENYVLRPKRPIHRIHPSNYEFDKPVSRAPSKRAALLLDRLMVALQKAVDNGSDPSQMKGYYSEKGSGLQRRDQDKGKVYWRCYFNAVTCF